MKNTIGVFANPMPEPLVALDDEKDLVQEQEQEEERQLKTLASLAEHPGWELVKGIFEARIDDFRSGRTIASQVSNKTDAELGQMLRGEIHAADTIAIVLEQVDNAASTIQERREELIRERRNTKGVS